MDDYFHYEPVKYVPEDIERQSDLDKENSEKSSKDSNDFSKKFQLREFYNFEPLYLDRSRLGKGRLIHVV